LRPVVAKWESKYDIDPFTVKDEEQIELLLEADRLMRANKGVRVAQGNIVAFREEKVFASTEGSFIEQIKTETGAGISALAADKGKFRGVRILILPEGIGHPAATNLFWRWIFPGTQREWQTRLWRLFRQNSVRKNLPR